MSQRMAADADTGGGDNVAVESLLRELAARKQLDIDATDDGALHPTGDGPRDVISGAMDTLFPDADVTFDPDLVRHSIDETLLLLLSLHRGGNHGGGLIEDLDEVFDTQVSSGTIYPHLHDLEEEGFLRIQQTVQTKEYQIDDSEAVRERLERSMRQHLSLGYAMALALENC